MNRQTFTLELITPCFCGGADPTQQAEIRPASIRGQLRWWFRVLGGFKSGLSESKIFGSIAGDEGAGLIRLAITESVISKPADRKNADDLNAGMGTDLGYALFPLRTFRDQDGKRGCLPEGASFSLVVTWRGNSNYWNDIVALISIWSHLGALGFRSRRTVGAIRITNPTLSIGDALKAFNGTLIIKQLPCTHSGTWRTTSETLLKWYRSWRQHGQMNRRWDQRNNTWVPISNQQKQENRQQPGFKYARRDHNEGLDVQGTAAPYPDPENPEGNAGVTFRPALGLPIIQFFSSLGGTNGRIPRGRATVNWEFSQNGGRFASPVLLRPHRDTSGAWHALVIFVDVHQWPQGQQVYLNGIARSVSLDLYNAMKADTRLSSFL